MSEKMTTKLTLNNETQVNRRIFNSEDELFNSIPEEGSLGLLAYGFKGLQAWREKRGRNNKKE